MAVALGNLHRAIGFGREGAGLEFAGPRSEAHGAAHFVHTEKFAEFVDDAIRSGGIEFGAISVFDMRNLARVFDRRALHAETDAEERDFFLAGVGDGVNHSGDAAFAETAGNQNTVDVAQQALGGGWRVNFFGFNPFDYYALAIGQAAVAQGFAQTFVSVFELHILPYYTDANLSVGMLERFQHRQ